MKTASWSAALPADHQRIGISFGRPRGQPAGYRLYKALAPGSWFRDLGPVPYYQRYRDEVLGRLDPLRVRDELETLAGGKIPTLLCYERPGGSSWCHRAMAAEWLAGRLGIEVPEFGFEGRAQADHPLFPPELRGPGPLLAGIPGVTQFLGRSALIDGVRHTVTGQDPARPGMAVVRTEDGAIYSTGADSLQRFFVE